MFYVNKDHNYDHPDRNPEIQPQRSQPQRHETPQQHRSRKKPAQREKEKQDRKLDDKMFKSL
jgi:hypothetical protein